MPGKVLVAVLDGEAHARVSQELGLREEALSATLLRQQELDLAQRAAVLEEFNGQALALPHDLVITLESEAKTLFHS